MAAADGGPCASYFVAVVENRAKEIGLAALDTQRLRLTLVQFVETSRSYVQTLSLLHDTYPPAQLVVVSNEKLAFSSGLNKATLVFPQIPLKRSAFDDAKATVSLSACGTPTSRASLDSPAVRNSHYLALGAAGALLCFLEEEEHLILTAGSVNISFSIPASYMHIDPSTVRALELVQPLGGGSKKALSLFNRMNLAKTKCGARLLRANLLQPTTHIATLQLRLDAVEELLAKEELLWNAQRCLAALPRDAERVCGDLALWPRAMKNDMTHTLSALVHGTILLREMLKALPSFVESLAPATSDLLKAVCSSCGHPTFAAMLETLNATLEPEVQPSKVAFINQTQQCFAVKNGVNSLLDVARATFCQLSEDVHELARKYKEQYGLAALKMQHAARRGFYISLPKPGSQTKDGATIDQYPAKFIPIQGEGKGTSAKYTTHELNALNARLNDSRCDCLVLSSQIMEAYVAEVVRDMSLVHILLDNVSLLDMLCSFATLAREASRMHVRPQISDEGPIAIVGGRHPLLDEADGMVFEANDTYLAECASFNIIVGPNMAGKSVYLRQVSLIVIMAQMGCYVPAEFASIRIVDRLLTRLGMSDSIATSSSSFMVEMQETAHILTHVTPASLVIVDELGRATSTADGVGIAWAVAENLIALGAYTLFATHFAELSELAGLYPNAKLWHMTVAIEEGKLHYTRRLKPGPQAIAHYGLMLTSTVGLDSAITAEALRIVQSIERGHERDDGHALHAQPGHVALDATPSAASAADADLCEHFSPNLGKHYSLAHRLACISRKCKGRADAEVVLLLHSLQAEAKQVQVAWTAGSN